MPLYRLSEEQRDILQETMENFDPYYDTVIESLLKEIITALRKDVKKEISDKIEAEKGNVESDDYCEDEKEGWRSFNGGLTKAQEIVKEM